MQISFKFLLNNKSERFSFVSSCVYQTCNYADELEPDPRSSKVRIPGSIVF
jgi:hypothetical protein